MNSVARTALQYVLLFGASGVSLPFAGLWFRSQGWSGAEIGALLALPMLGRVATGPLIAVWADGFARRRTAIALVGLAMAVGYGGAGLFEGFLPRALCWFVGATAAAALIPLTDVLTLRLARREGFAFALPRGCGSAAFVLANVAMGLLLTRASADVVIVWITAAAGLIAVTAWLWLPPEPVLAHGAPALSLKARFAGLGRLTKNRVFMTAILGVGAVQASHAFYYGFSAIVWKAQGLPESLTGALWAFSVAVEIGFMWLIEPWRRRAGVGAWPLLMLGAGAAVVRWSLMALAPPLWALWPLQVLHAPTFAATYLAGVQMVEALSPPEDHTAAQTLASVLSSGVLIGAATAVAGPMYDRIGVTSYLAMAALGAAGGAAAWMIRRPLAGAAR